MSAVATNPTTVAGETRGLVGLLTGRRKADYWILAAVAGMCLMGIIMVYSASYAQALTEQAGDLNPKPAVYALKQLQNMLVGSIALVVFSVVPYPFWRRFSVPLGGIVLLALLLVLFGGDWI